jgi:hypothetical protein
MVMMLNWLKKKMGLNNIHSDLHTLKEYVDKRYIDLEKNINVLEQEADVDRKIIKAQIHNIKKTSELLERNFNSLAQQTEKMATIGVNIEELKDYGCNWGIILINNPNNQRVEMFNIKDKEIIDRMYQMLKYSQSIVDAPRFITNIIDESKKRK